MALTKIGKEGITGVSNAANATFLTATSAEGVTLAGTLAVTGVHTVGTNAVATSNGGAVTTSVIQGLAKVRHSSNVAGTTLHSGLNVSSLGDTATGKETINLTNAMSNDLYSVTHGSGSKNGGSARMELTDSLGTSSYQVHSYTNNNALGDNSTCSIAHGDLA